MKKQVINLDRRQVLHAAGGFTLALPWLPSLLTKAYGADPLFPRRVRFAAMMTDHGGVLPENMFPAQSVLTARETIFTGHAAGVGPLKLSVAGSDAQVCPVLKAPASSFTPALAAKMNVVRGLDVPFYISHNTGLHLGNYARNDGNGEPGRYVQGFPVPTIDQVMAWSPSVYSAGELANVKLRAVVTGTRGGYSWNYSNPAAKTGNIQEVQPNSSSLALFNQLFIPSNSTPAPRKAIADLVLANYRSLRESNRRLSTADKQRLDDHMAAVAELQRKVTATASAGSCKNFSKPAQDADAVGGDSKKRLSLLNDVIVMGFICGSTRIASVSVADPLVAYTGSWHQETAHQWPNPDAQSRLVGHNRNAFEWSFLDLARKLDVEETPGVTYLDNSVLAWSQESGFNTHEAAGIPLVTFGSAGGQLKTGLFVDYRNTGRALSKRGLEAAGYSEFMGLTFNRWLATALQLMGVPRSEFERFGATGYGHPHVDGSYMGKYVSGVLETASSKMPLLMV